MLIDSHCHLDFPEFAADLHSILQRAARAGVTRLITINTRIRRFPQLLELAERFPGVSCTVGTHPHNAAEEDGISADDIVALVTHPKVVGIGEAGLDYYYDKAPREAQTRGLRTHIEASRRTNLPLVIHARNADADMANILEVEYARGAFSAVLHCFSSGAELARRGLALGFYLSFSGILTFKNTEDLRAIATDAPVDRILVETDAPYLAPGRFRGKRNEPSYVVETARVLSELKGISIEALSQITSQNTERLFWKLPKDAISLEAAG